MKFQATDIATLLLKKISGQLTAEEAAALEEWKNASAANRREYEDLLQLTVVKDELTHYRDAQAVGKRLTIPRVAGTPIPEDAQATASPSAHRPPFLRRYWAAASVILVLGIGAYFWYQGSSRPQTLTSDNKYLPTDIEPGRNGAILTLADGTEMVLDSLGNGLIALQSGTQVVLQDGQLAYDPAAEAAGSMVYNTMSTPKGRQFNLRLPDGTRVWLNAASSIRYPTIFTGTERKVEVTGEAYFEVVQNKQQPFRVNVADKAEVEVLGTHFNVNAYENEATINATLIEGSVKVLVGQKTQQGNNKPSQVVSSDRAVILKPGQQAQITDAIRVVNDADTDNVMAWKNGFIYFDGATFDEIMRQLERWYDIEVVYEQHVPDVALMGEMTRGVSLNGLLTALEKMGVHYRLEGRKLTVLP